MPTDKPPFTFYMQSDYLEKMRYIAKQETRSVSNLLCHLCHEYVDNYEREYGAIELPPEELYPIDPRQKGK